MRGASLLGSSRPLNGGKVLIEALSGVYVGALVRGAT